MRQDQSDPQAPAVLHYNRGLANLRSTLKDARKASETETLCAAMLLAFCQARFDDQFTFFWSPHGAGIAQLIRMRKFTGGQDSFERSISGSLHGTLLLQSFANPSVQLTAQEYQNLEDTFLRIAGSTPDIRPWQLMAQISQMMAQARQAISSGSPLTAIAIKAKEYERSMQAILVDMHERLRAFEAQYSSEPYLDTRTHASYQRAYGVALATHAILLCARRTLSPKDLTVESAAAELCHEALRVAHDAHAYRPLGAVWTVHTLICTWCATQDASLRTNVEDALLEYQRDAMGPKAELQMDRLRLLERRLGLLE
ncbi:MAG: hypothetical protein Q9227_000558 [Pyrenula ochraceoflavens]